MNRGDIQGLLFSGYAAQPASALILLRFVDGRPHAWLRRILPQVSSGAPAERRDPFRLNLAFTFRGLEKLRLPSDTLAGFSREFRQGMAHPERSAALGDRAPCDPAHWEFADCEARGVDGAVLVYAPSAARLDQKLEELEQGSRRFGLEPELLRTYLPSDGLEHFGFRMGMWEPNVRGIGRRRAPGPRIATGEFVLGYADGVGDRKLGPNAPALRTTRQPPAMAERGRRVNFGLNGSYLVVRKLEQRVHAFRAFLEAGESQDALRERLAAQGVGRLANGASLDSMGLCCPLGAYVRRANPPDFLKGDEAVGNRHRLLRRDRLYGAPVLEPGDGDERGLLFLALNADIARQFEHIQGQCLAARAFAGLRDEPDPVLGQDSLDQAGERSFNLPGEHVRRRLTGLSHWLRVRGGLYGFLPSLRALGYLADLDDARVRP